MRNLNDQISNRLADDLFFYKAGGDNEIPVNTTGHPIYDRIRVAAYIAVRDAVNAVEFELRPDVQDRIREVNYDEKF
jgi:hypothetical protein